MNKQIFRIDMLRAKVMVRFDDDLTTAKHKTEKFLGCRVADPVRGIAGYAVAHYRKVVVYLAPDASLGTVLHECYHALTDFWKRLDQKLKMKN